MSNDAFYDDEVDPLLADGFHEVDEELEDDLLADDLGDSEKTKIASDDDLDDELLLDEDPLIPLDPETDVEDF